MPPPPFSPQLHALYIFNLEGGQSHSIDRAKTVVVRPNLYSAPTPSHSIDRAKAVVVRPYLYSAPTPNREFSCMQLTDRRIYFTWEDARRRDVPLFKDEEDTRPEPSSPGTAELSQGAWVNPEFGGHSPSP